MVTRGSCRCVCCSSIVHMQCKTFVRPSVRLSVSLKGSNQNKNVFLAWPVHWLCVSTCHLLQVEEKIVLRSIVTDESLIASFRLRNCQWTKSIKMWKKLIQLVSTTYALILEQWYFWLCDSANISTKSFFFSFFDARVFFLFVINGLCSSLMNFWYKNGRSTS